MDATAAMTRALARAVFRSRMLIAGVSRDLTHISSRHHHPLKATAKATEKARIAQERAVEKEKLAKEKEEREKLVRKKAEVERVKERQAQEKAAEEEKVRATMQQLLEILTQTISNPLRLLPRTTWDDGSSFDGVLCDTLKGDDFLDDGGDDAAGEEDEVAALTLALERQARWMAKLSKTANLQSRPTYP